MKKSFFRSCRWSIRSELNTVTRNQRFRCNFPASLPCSVLRIVITSCSCSASVLMGKALWSGQKLCEHGIPRITNCIAVTAHHSIQRHTNCRNSQASTIRVIIPPHPSPPSDFWSIRPCKSPRRRRYGAVK